MESTIGFLCIVITALSLTVVTLGNRLRQYRRPKEEYEAELRALRREVAAANADADDWCTKYSRAERERVHLEMDRDRLRGLLMTKQGAGKN